MPVYTEQFFLMDPANPPGVGTFLTFERLSIEDANNDLDFDRFNGDSVNGSDITASYPGDTVTINNGTIDITYVGITFYTADGARYFTPNDGQILENGTLVDTSWVTPQGPLTVTQAGPSCFVSGTRLRTPWGMRPVEDIGVGALVKTMDHGVQTVRWAGRRTVAGSGAFAPVRFAPGTLGNKRPLWVSQQHRMLVRGALAELHFGARQVLIAAKHLVNGRDVVFAPCRSVTYHHLLFDSHEIVFAENAPSESFHPGDMVQEDQAVLAELQALFPDFAARQTQGAWAMARPVVRRGEAAALVH